MLDVISILLVHPPVKATIYLIKESRFWDKYKLISKTKARRVVFFFEVVEDEKERVIAGGFYPVGFRFFTNPKKPPKSGVFGVKR